MLTLTDMFCGAGGSSTGALQVPGIQVRTAMNHWARAIETHNTNHPDTDHVCADIQQVDPDYITPSDILWASPECTNHSVAKGRRRATAQSALFGGTGEDAAAIKSRATMWDVPRFAEIHRYRYIITENVVDAARWIMFEAWLQAMRALGYQHHIVYLNSMHAQLAGAPAPQSRDRMYVVFWLDGERKPDFDKLRPAAWCQECGQIVRSVQAFKKPDQRWGRYRAQYVYRCPNGACRNSVVEPAWLPAAAAIDWSIRGQRIGDRAKPLAPKTMARIRAGLEKYGRQAMQVTAAGNTYDAATRGGSYYRIWPTTEALRTQTGTAEHALLVPVEGRDGKDARPVVEAMRTQTTRNETGLLSMPLIVNHVSGSDGSRSAPVTDPLRTLVGGGLHESLLIPPTSPTFLTQFRDRVRDLDPHAEPLNTVVADGANYAMITMRGQNAPKSPADTFDTFAANGTHHALTTVDVPAIEDCEFRMLEPHEITAGMAFPKTYIMTGNKREQVKQAGNAVTPPAARDLLTIVAEAMA